MHGGDTGMCIVHLTQLRQSTIGHGALGVGHWASGIGRGADDCGEAHALWAMAEDERSPECKWPLAVKNERPSSARRARGVAPRCHPLRQRKTSSNDPSPTGRSTISTR